MYDVVLAKSARKVFENSRPEIQKRLDRCFVALADNPRLHNNIKPLKGRFAAYWRFRIGDYRAVYRIDDANRQVIVVDIADRKDVYE